MNDRKWAFASMRAIRTLLDKSPALRRLWFPFYFIFWLSRACQAVLHFFANEYLKSRLGHCGKNVWLHGSMFISSPRNVRIGRNVHINRNAFIRGEGGLTIGDNTHISRNIVIYTVNHNYEGSSLPYDSTFVQKPVAIGRNVWIGMNVLIAPGVTIGDGAIIGMGTVVSRNVGALEIVGNQPCRVLKTRNSRHYQQLETARSYSGPSGQPLKREQ